MDGLDCAHAVGARGGPRGRRLTPGRVTGGRARPRRHQRLRLRRPGRRAFYPPGSKSRDLLPALRRAAAGLRAEQHVLRAARRSTRSTAGARRRRRGFRFVVKAQRGASIRALYGDPATSVPWLTETLPTFGERLGAVLFRVPGEVKRQDEQLAGLLAAWPRVHPARARGAARVVARRRDVRGAAGAPAPCCARRTSTSSTTPPDIRRTGPFLYLRLRRTTYDDDGARRAGRAGSCRSSTTGSTPTSCSATTRTARAPSTRRRSRTASSGCARPG